MPVHFSPIRSQLFRLDSQGYQQEENERAAITVDTFRPKAINYLDEIHQSIVWCAIFSSSFLSMQPLL